MKLNSIIAINTGAVLRVARAMALDLVNGGLWRFTTKGKWRRSR